MYPFGQANVPLGVHLPQVGNLWSSITCALLIERSVSQLLPMEQQPCKFILMELSKKIKHISLHCVSTLCMIHWEELVVKRLIKENNHCSGLEIVLDDVKNFVNFIRSHFQEASSVFRILQRHESRHSEIIYHAEARWVTRGNVSEQVFQLRQELRVFLAQTRSPNVH